MSDTDLLTSTLSRDSGILRILCPLATGLCSLTSEPDNYFEQKILAAEDSKSKDKLGLLLSRC